MKNLWHSSIGLSLHLGLDFVAALLVGVWVGHSFDLYCNSYPWGLVIFIVIGIIAGSLNVYRSIRLLIGDKKTSREIPLDDKN